jgi:hypothetical protein
MIYGKLLITIGLILVALGLVINYAPWSLFGKLPGDIRIEDENKSLFIPITSSIAISIILSIVANLLFRK